MSANREALIAQWVEEARDLGVQHASGQGSDDRPEDAIDLNAYGSMSYGEMAEIQDALRAAYDEGKSGAAATCPNCGLPIGGDPGPADLPCEVCGQGMGMNWTPAL